MDELDFAVILRKLKDFFCKMARAGRACALAAPSHTERPHRQEGRPKRGGARDVELSLRNPICKLEVHAQSEFGERMEYLHVGNI